MIITAVKGLPKLHKTPLASVSCVSPQVVIEVDDAMESRFKMTFSPCQAFKMVTTDCFKFPDGMSVMPQAVMEIRNSPWLEELRSALKVADCKADFMDKAKHFFIPLGDDIFEVVAWNVQVEYI